MSFKKSRQIVLFSTSGIGSSRRSLDIFSYHLPQLIASLHLSALLNSKTFAFNNDYQSMTVRQLPHVLAKV
eukprot:scaffold4059_cov174-Ochromonas_danica.AAC.5